MKSVDRRAKHKEDLRNQILEAARRLFVERGFEAVTMRQIAGAIGYTATTLYSYFPDKMSLLLGLCVSDFAALRAQMGEVLDISDPVQRLAAIGRGYATFVLSHPHHARLMFMTPSLPQHEDEHEVCGRGDPTRDSYALVVDTIRAIDEAGRLRPEFADHQLAAQLVWAGIHGVVALQLDKGNDTWVPWVPVEARIAGMLRTLIGGITTG